MCFNSKNGFNLKKIFTEVFKFFFNIIKNKKF